MGLADKAVAKAKAVMRKCSTKHGVFASGGPHGYNSVWARDSMIGLIGTSCMDERKEFKKAFAATLRTLSRHQSKLGQIANCVDLYDKSRPKQVTFATLDSTLWYLIGHQFYARNYGDKALVEKYGKEIEKAFLWLRYQDLGEDGLPDQLPTTDWQDCFPHKYGHVLNTQALYYSALRLWHRRKSAAHVRRIVTGTTRAKIAMFNNREGFYYPWVWKNHNGIVEREQWFDSLGNVLAICFGLANKRNARKILNYVEANKVNEPFPLKAIHPPIRKGSGEWHDYFSKSLAARPHWYLNGGIWPYIGGFYVASLVADKQFSKADEELLKLAKANSLGRRFQWEFNEWIHPIKGKAMGSAYHAWSAGAYLFAYKSVQDKSVPLLGVLEAKK